MEKCRWGKVDELVKGDCVARGIGPGKNGAGTGAVGG